MAQVDKKKSSNFKRLYRGAFVYTSGGTQYTEETFEVFKEKKDLNLHYDSEILTRVATGEMLKINVSYIVNKEWTPMEVLVTRNLGVNTIDESFTYNPRKNLLRYSFKSLHDKKDDEITTPPKFHIQTPAAASSMLFINSKKIDQTARNHFHIIFSPNVWRYEEKLKVKNLAIMRTKIGELDTIALGKSNLQSIEYQLFEDNEVAAPTKKGQSKQKDEKNSSTKPTEFLFVYLSKHVGIPYRLVQNQDTHVEIKYLNDFSGDETEEIL